MDMEILSSFFLFTFDNKTASISEGVIFQCLAIDIDDDYSDVDNYIDDDDNNGDNDNNGDDDNNGNGDNNDNFYNHDNDNNGDDDNFDNDNNVDDHFGFGNSRVCYFCSFSNEHVNSKSFLMHLF